MWLQPEGTIIKINAPGIDPVEITSKDLAAPTSVWPTFNDYIRVFCLYAVTISNFEVADGKIKGKTEELQREVLRSQGRLFKDKFVTYYDSTFHGSIPDIESPFRKQMRFGYQREYRVCVYPVVKIDAPITIKDRRYIGILQKRESCGN